MENKKLKRINGFTLIEALVGTFLIVIVFMGILGSYELGIRVISQSKNKIIATALANEELEKVRNVPYGVVGIDGGTLPTPEGMFEASSIITRNGIDFQVDRVIEYIADEADGLGSGDTCDLDYKKVEVKISWDERYSGEVILITDVAPMNTVEELNSCTAQPGGILSVTVFDAFGLWVGRGAPRIEIFNVNTGASIAFQQPESGKHNFLLPAIDYKVVISKSGYSTGRTYGVAEVTTPEKPNPLVLEGKLTAISFSIDKVSVLAVDTLSPWGVDYFSDSFPNSDNITNMTNVVITGGQARLDMIAGEYQSPGEVSSIDIIPVDLFGWEEFSWEDTEVSGTQIVYHILYYNGFDWILIPDGSLAGNSSGFGVSPIDLTGLDPVTYLQVRIKADLSTSDVLVTPTLQSWQISWKDTLAVPIPGVSFDLQGAKVIGEDASGDPVYKYLQTHSSDGTGHIDITDMEWDLYTFSVDPLSGLDIDSTNPNPQPINLFPDTNLPVSLYLKAQNSLLITTKDSETSDPIFSTEVRIYNAGLTYDVTQYTDTDGQTYFIPLGADSYTIEAQGPGYIAYTGSITVSGDNSRIINLDAID